MTTFRQRRLLLHLNATHRIAVAVREKLALHATRRRTDRHLLVSIKSFEFSRRPFATEIRVQLCDERRKRFIIIQLERRALAVAWRTAPPGGDTVAMSSKKPAEECLLVRSLGV
jgi:hypothetical protein